METFYTGLLNYNFTFTRTVLYFTKKSTSNTIFLHIKSGNKTILSHQSDIGI